MNKQELWDLYISCPPIIRRAIEALLDFELQVDPIGYDISYYQEERAPRIPTNKDRRCSCGDYVYGTNWACGPSGCSNVAG